MRIAVDAMGTDARPTPDVAGSVMAARERGDTILLVGPEDAIRRELEKHDTTDLKLEIVHTNQHILMADKPSIASKEKRNSTMHLGMTLVTEGQADAFVTAGNTGAAYAIAMLYTLRRIPGVMRPALSGIFPMNQLPVIFLDIGANSDCKPGWLAQFAQMGSIYAVNALKQEQPRVGLLSNGEEEGKGNQLTREADALIRTLPLHYIGYVEPTDIPRGNVDVVVADGFTGNILIKTFEAAASYLVDTIRDEIKASVLTSIGGLIARPAFQRAGRKLDTSEIGGAPLLGVNGVVIIAHGGSDANAIKNAIFQAGEAARSKVVDIIRDNIVQA
jgi:phosphate acyltransferase